MNLEAIDWVGIVLIIAVVGYVAHKIFKPKGSSKSCGCGGGSGKCKSKKY